MDLSTKTSKGELKTATYPKDDREFSKVYVICKKLHFHPVKPQWSTTALVVQENTPLGERTEISNNYCWSRRLLPREQESAFYANRLRVPCPAEVNTLLPVMSSVNEVEKMGQLEREGSQAQPRPQEASEEEEGEFAKVFVICKKRHFHPVIPQFSNKVLEMNENTPLGQQTVIASSYCWRRTLFAREHKKAESADRVRVECPAENKLLLLRNYATKEGFSQSPSLQYTSEVYQLSRRVFRLEMQMNHQTELLEKIFKSIKNQNE